LNIINQLVVGIHRHPFRLITTSFVAYSVLWTIIESSSAFFPNHKPEGWKYYTAMIVAGAIYGVYQTTPRQTTRLRMKSINATVEVSFGDIFQSPYYKVIPVNEFFDGELGGHVSERSIHGQFIKQYFSGHPLPFNTLVEIELKGITSKKIPRTSGKTEQYPIGTTPVIQVQNDRFFLPAVAYTNLTTLKAYCDVPTLWQALAGLWSSVRNNAGGAPVTLPLIGGGLAGVGIPPQQLLHLIILSFVTACKMTPIVSPAHIILPYSLFDEIDLETLENQWN
jgi:hypothetical protein